MCGPGLQTRFEVDLKLNPRIVPEVNPDRVSLNRFP